MNKKNIKKIAAVAFVFVMFISFAACDKDVDESDDAGEKVPKISSAVVYEVEDYFDDMGAKVGKLKEEYKHTYNGAVFYVISGRIEDASADEDYYGMDIEEYIDGYFIGAAYEYDGEVYYMNMHKYEKDEKDDFEADLKDYVDECKDYKHETEDMIDDFIKLQEL